MHGAKLAAETHAHAKLRERFQPELRAEQWTQTGTDMYEGARVEADNTSVTVEAHGVFEHTLEEELPLHLGGELCWWAHTLVPQDHAASFNVSAYYLVQLLVPLFTCI